jgi:hypothetical protein
MPAVRAKKSRRTCRQGVATNYVAKREMTIHLYLDNSKLGTRHGVRRAVITQA